MHRCIELALNGAGHVSPNPMVGAVIVHNDKIIGEGWHQKFGEAHAEINAINSVADKSLLSESTIYVNLEPCSHFGKTPPCVDAIIKHQFKKVVIGMLDPFEKVAGEGMKRLRLANRSISAGRDEGMKVEENVLQKECEELNKRFITFHTQKQPYIILKWAQTSDGFISPDATKMSAAEFEEKRHITGFIVQKLVHKWRTEEDAILIGTNTAVSDNPALNARAYAGRNPIRIVIDRTLRIPLNYKIFDHSQPTIIFTEKQKPAEHNLQFIQIDFGRNMAQQIAEQLYNQNIQSVIIEGGLQTLQTFIAAGLWNEAQIFTSPKYLVTGIKAPDITGKIIHQNSIDNNRLTIYKNQ